MKKKMLILAGFAVVAMSAAAAITVYSSQSNRLSSVLMQNVEALAADEGQTDPIECPGGKTECARIVVGNTVYIFEKS